MKVYTGVWQ